MQACDILPDNSQAFVSFIYFLFQLLTLVLYMVSYYFLMEACDVLPDNSQAFVSYLFYLYI